MTRSARLIFCRALIPLSILLLTHPAPGITVGGWTATRGGDSGILAGADFAALRNDLSAYFVGVTLSQTSVLTSTFLNSIDVLVISPVYGGNSDPSNPLTAAEQSAMTSWVSGGGRALVVAENFNYYDASQSMVGPFGPQWASASFDGFIDGIVTDHTSFPTITNGPFGVVTDFTGSYAAYFADVEPATPLGEWGFSAVSLAAMNYGSGKVVFFGDNTLLYGADAGINPSNDTLRRNTLTYLLGVAPKNQYDYNANGAVDAADYALWRKTFGQTGSSLPADGNSSHEIDNPDYALWRAHFGETNASGSGSSLAPAAVPEPTSATLLMIAICIAATRQKRR